MNVGNKPIKSDIKINFGTRIHMQPIAAIVAGYDD